MEWKPTDGLSPTIRYSHYAPSTATAASAKCRKRYVVVYGDPVEHSDDGWSPMATLTVEPVDGWQIYGKAGSAMRSPSPFEGISGSSFAYLDSTAVVEPERNKSIEIGTNYLGNDVIIPGDKLRLRGIFPKQG